MKRAALFLLALAGVGVAFAEPANMATASMAVGGMAPPADDPVLNYLGQLVGNIGGFTNGNRTDIVQMFTVFNTATVALGALMFMWNTLSATINGAHDGEFLGKRYHSYWLPMRTVFGLAFILPAMGGWSLAQVMMAWAAWGGTGIANAVISSTNVAEIIVKAHNNVPMPPLPSGQKFAHDMFNAWECVIQARWDQRVRAGINPELGAGNFGATPITDRKNYVGWQYGDTSGTQASTAACGEVGFQFDFDTAENAAVTKVHEGYKKAVTAGLLEMHSNASTVAAEFDRLTYADAESWQSYADAWYAYRRNAGRIFDMTAYDALRAEIPEASKEATEAAKKFITDYSWIGVGLAGIPSAITSFSASRIGGEASGVATNTASIGSGELAGNLRPTKAAETRSMTQLNDDLELAHMNLTAAKSQKNTEAIERRSKEIAALNEQIANTNMTAYENFNLGGTEIKDASGNTVGKLDHLRDRLANQFNALMKSEAKKAAAAAAGIMKAKSAPLAGMQEVGINIIGWAGIAIVTIFALSATVSILSGGLLGGVASSFVSTSLFILTPLMFFAIKLAAILPFSPLMYWIPAVTAYFVIFIEALFGAQLWAMAHLDTDGEGMGQKTTHGYMFLLNLAFRPSIMVITFVLATTLTNIMGGIASGAIGEFIISVANNNSTGWLASFVILIGGIWVWVSMMEAIIHTCYSLVSTVPNQVFAWLGAHFGSDVGAGMASSASGKAEGMASGVGGAASSTGQNAAGGVRTAGDAAGNAKVFSEDGVDGRVSANQKRGADRDVQNEQLRHSRTGLGDSRTPSSSSSDGGGKNAISKRKGD